MVVVCQLDGGDVLLEGARPDLVLSGVNHGQNISEDVSLSGTVAGAGAVMATACDFRVAAENAKIAFLFTKVGLSGADQEVRHLHDRAHRGGEPHPQHLAAAQGVEPLERER